MNDTETTHFGLEQWLAVATDGLVPDAMLRARQELAVHFHSAVERLLNQGMAPDKARWCALQDLGRPDQVNHSLRRAHMTMDDVQSIHHHLRKYHRFSKMAWDVANSLSLSYLIGFACRWLMLDDSPQTLYWWLILPLGCFVILTLMFLELRRWERNSRLQAYYAWRTISAFFPALGMAGMPAALCHFRVIHFLMRSTRFTAQEYWLLFFGQWILWTLVIWPVFLIPRWRFHRKLRRAIAAGEYGDNIRVKEFKS